jgi:hypothetical protein
MVPGSASGHGDADRDLGLAQWVWSLLRGTAEKLAMDAGDQIEDPEIGECFDWDPSYEMSSECADFGWISAELRALLDRIDDLLNQLSDDRAAWSDEAIITHPLWEQVRRVAREVVPLMPGEPWASQGG